MLACAGTLAVSLPSSSLEITHLPLSRGFINAHRLIWIKESFAWRF
jgi:hypothetical protein